ncbi:MAG TPA: HAD-IIIC family phosphatase [Nitrospira sp.]|nr:HAD-IIIC family phosphatase [Nitrospira sp.]
MNFLEARKILAAFGGGPERAFLFGMSGTPDPLRMYLEAAGAQRGLDARPRFLPFNTLAQHLASEPDGTDTIYLLLPWDLVPEADWRSGVPATRLDLAKAVARAREVANSIRRRPQSRILYLPASIPPISGSAGGDRTLVRSLEEVAAEIGARFLPPDAFSLGTYFSSGCPVGGAWLGRVAMTALAALVEPPPSAAKVLVTDLDNTLWAGVIAEDGPEGIRFGPEGAGYRHFAYQSLLARLRREGTLLAAVSRNDAAVVLPPLKSGRMALHEEDFVAVVASYHAKSAQIRELAAQLNLGLDAFVFVDDNPVELEEVHQSLPAVRCLPFPASDEGLPAMLDLLSSSFARGAITQEDQDRTALYRRRMDGLAPSHATGADLTRFLADLRMQLRIHDRSTGDRVRAVQLINKTNQFNANGRRWTDEEVAAVLSTGGRLYGASLSDRSGDHGEVIACLIDASGTIEAFVMSCRVFQRRAEAAFLASLAGRGVLPNRLRHAGTERNEPFRQFLQQDGFAPATGDLLSFDAPAFAAAHSDDLALFEVAWA